MHKRNKLRSEVPVIFNMFLHDKMKIMLNDLLLILEFFFNFHQFHLILLMSACISFAEYF